MQVFYNFLIIHCLLQLFWWNESSAANSFSLINSEGSIKSSTVVDSFFDNSLIGQQESPAVLGIIDCSTNNADCSLVNSLFNSQFTPTNNGVAVEIVDDKVILLKGCFTEMFSSSKFSGSRLVQYFNNLACPVVMMVRSDNIDETIVAYDQVFKRLLHDLSAKTASKKQLAFVVETKESSDSISVALHNALEKIWSDKTDKVDPPPSPTSPFFPRSHFLYF